MSLNIKIYFRSGKTQLLEKVNYTDELREQLNDKLKSGIIVDLKCIQTVYKYTNQQFFHSINPFGDNNFSAPFQAVHQTTSIFLDMVLFQGT